jgi:hypothetical protein
MKKYRNGILLTILLVLPCLLLAQDRTYPDLDEGVNPAPFQQVGQSGWQFLKLPTHARYAAIGGVSSSLSHGDAAAALANPASVADIEDINVSFSRMNWLVDTDYSSGSIVKNMGSIGYLGLNFVYVDYGSVQRTSVSNLVDENGDITGLSELVLEGLGTYESHDVAVGLTYARTITDRLQVGGNLRYVSETLDDATTGNLSFDIGTVYYTGLKSLRIAMVGRNFGPDAEFVSFDQRVAVPATKVRMPMSFQLGAAFDILEGGDSSPYLWTVAAELIHPNDGPEKFNVGTEYSLFNLLSLRGGYRFNYDEEDLTLGAGINVKTSSIGVGVNYAYIDFGRLSEVHMFSIDLKL